MPKRFIKRYIPTPDKIKNIKGLQFLGKLLHEPNLWHINRHSIARAVLIGMFWAFIPIPLQMLPAAIFAIWFNANLPVSISLVWLTNPLTMPPVFYLNYKIGAMLLHQPAMPFDFELSWQWVSERLSEVGLPLFLGSFVCGLLAALISYLLVQFFWRRHVRREWQKRQLRNQA